MSRDIDILPTSYIPQTIHENCFGGVRVISMSNRTAPNTFYSRHNLSFNTQSPSSQRYVQKRNVSSSFLLDYQPSVLRGNTVFTKIPNYYDGPLKQSYNSSSLVGGNSGARVVMVRPSNCVNQSNSNFQNSRVGLCNSNVTKRNIIRVDSAGNKYVQLPNGQLSQVFSRANQNTQQSYLSRNVMEPRFLTAGVLAARRNILPYFNDEIENINDSIICQDENNCRKDIEFSHHTTPYNRHNSFRYNCIQDKQRTGTIHNSRYKYERERFSSFLNYGLSNNSLPYRNTQNHQSTTFVPASFIENASQTTQIKLTDSENIKICKLVLQEIVNEICFPEETFSSNNKLSTPGLLLNNGRLFSSNLLNCRNQNLNQTLLFSSQTPQLNETLRKKQVPEHGIYVGTSLFSHSVSKRVTEDELNKFTENLKKEINKRRLILEHRAEEEIGIQTPWRRTRTKSIKPLKKLIQKKENALESLELCDPRYITLGGTVALDKDIPLKMELDFSGNAKITTANEMINEVNLVLNSNNIEKNENVDNNNDDFLITKKDTNLNLNDNLSKKHSSDNETIFYTKKLKSKKTIKQLPSQRRMTTFPSLQSGLNCKSKPVSTSSVDNAKNDYNKEVDLEKSWKKSIAEKHNKTKLKLVGKRKSLKQTLNSKKISNKSSFTIKKNNTISQRTCITLASVKFQKSTSQNIGAKNSVGKYCPCGGSYDAKKFYISCNVCNCWYHGKCVSVTEKKAQKLLEDNAKNDGKSGWVCSDCEKARTQFSTEVYCVCRRPYDDTKFYVGCDSCEDWFHPECIGTTQTEVTKVDTFLCPKCRESDI